MDYLNVIAEAISAVNAGANDDLYHAVMLNTPYQFKGHYYRLPDGTSAEASGETSVGGHATVLFFGSYGVSASSVLNEFEFIV